MIDDQQRARELLADAVRAIYPDDASTRYVIAQLERDHLDMISMPAALQAIAAALRAAPEVGDSYVVLQRVDVKRLLAGDEYSPGYELSRRRITACLDLHNQHGIAVVADSSQVVPSPALGAHEVHPEAVDAGLDLGKSGERLLAADALEHAVSVSAECDGLTAASEGPAIRYHCSEGIRGTLRRLLRYANTGDNKGNLKGQTMGEAAAFIAHAIAARPQGVKDV
ncbi:MAG: hypothetical protein ACN6O2_06635 [Stenotrophomonas sp.]